MFKRRTLFVIGAGASDEAGLPVGSVLAHKIRDKVRSQRADYGDATVSDKVLFGQIRRATSNDENNILAAYKKIHSGILLSKSIDDFLHIHRDDTNIVKVGKAAIVSTILEQEAESTLFVDQSNIYNVPNYEQLAGTWFVKLMRILGEGTNVSSASTILENVSFIVFNYDRCVQQILLYGIQHLYSISKNEANEIVNAATIIHPYGSIGPIDEVPFGGGQHRNFDYVQLSSRIKTYTEQLEQRDTIDKIREEVVSAKCIIFLGFAFHDQNLHLLRPGEPHPGKHLFGTAYGMSDYDADDVISWLSERFPDANSYVGSRDNIKLENKLKCTELFDSYARSIAG